MGSSVSQSRIQQRNRHRNVDQLVEHLTADKLVMWGLECLGRAELQFRCRTMIFLQRSRLGELQEHLAHERECAA